MPSPEENRQSQSQDEDQTQREARRSVVPLKLPGGPVREPVVNAADGENHDREEEGSAETKNPIHRSRGEDFGKGEAVPAGIDRRLSHIPAHRAEEGDEEKVTHHKRAAAGGKMNGLVRQPQPEMGANPRQAERRTIRGKGQPEPGRAQASQGGPESCGMDLANNDDEEKHGDQQASQSRPRKPSSSKQRMHLNSFKGALGFGLARTHTEETTMTKLDRGLVDWEPPAYRVVFEEGSRRNASLVKRKISPDSAVASSPSGTKQQPSMCSCRNGVVKGFIFESLSKAPSTFHTEAPPLETRPKSLPSGDKSAPVTGESILNLETNCRTTGSFCSVSGNRYNSAFLSLNTLEIR